MPRPPKASKDKTVVQAPMIAAPVVATASVDAAMFMKVRDAAHSRLVMIGNLIKQFGDDYMRQTNLLLGLPTVDVPSMDPLISLDGQFAAALSAAPAVPIPVAVPVEEKKERKKRTHDPNAPKRPLTPYFLYMQTARPIIANDLGADAPKGAVQEEGQRRWGSMAATEKAGWNQAYQYNLRLYNARVHSYKGGNPNAKNMTDDEASKYADEFGIPMPSSDGDGAQGASADAHGEVDDAPPTKTKKPGPGRKRKTADAEEIETAKAPATPASPDKKRRRSTKAPEEKEEPKKSGRKKAAK